MESLKQYVFMFTSGGQARGHCRVQCIGGRARIQVQVRLDAGVLLPQLAVFNAGGEAYPAGAMSKSGGNFSLTTDIAWPAGAVCTGAGVVDDTGSVILSAGKIPYDAARALQKASGHAPAAVVQEAHSEFTPSKPVPRSRPAPLPPEEQQPEVPGGTGGYSPVLPPDLVQDPPPQARPEAMPPGMPQGDSPQYWWQEPRCPYMEPPPQGDQPVYEAEPAYAPPDISDPSFRMQAYQEPEFIPEQPHSGIDSTGFFATIREETEMPSGVVSCPAAALHQADPFHGSDFEGWTWCKVQYEGLHWHYLIGENKAGQGPYARAVGVPGQYSLRPPPHLKGFDRFTVARDGTGYWLFFEEKAP